MVVGCTTTNAISVYHHWCCEFEPCSWRGVQHYVIKFVSDLQKGQWFSPGPPVSSTKKTDRHDITEILLKVALSTIKQTNKHTNHFAARGANFWEWWFLWNSLRVQKLNDLSEIVLQCAIIQSAVCYLYSSILIVYQHSWALKRNVFIINRSNGSV